MAEQVYNGEHEQDEAARLFLPDIDPEEAVGWPSDSTDVFFWEDEDRDYDPSVYEASLSSTLDIQDVLMADYGATHTTYGDNMTIWED